jgi:hypothetical protein
MEGRRVPDPEDLAAAIVEIRTQLQTMNDKLDKRFVPRELFDAHHRSLQDRVALELAGIRAAQEADRLTAERRSTEVKGVAEGARAISMWALGLIASAVVVALVGFLATNGGSP